MNDEIRAKALIDSGASLREIARCFSTPLDAYRYYALTVHNQFSLDHAATGTECVLCKNTSDLQPQKITWRAIVHDRTSGFIALVLLLLGHLTSKRVEVQFTTDHLYSSRCDRRLWW